jgi:hypothetical protein
VVTSRCDIIVGSSEFSDENGDGGEASAAEVEFDFNT